MTPDRETLWSPSPARVAGSTMAAYQRWLSAEKNVGTVDYQELWRWSVANLDEFWSSIWEYFDVIGERGSEVVLGDARMPGASWFPDATVNWAENLLRDVEGDRPALVALDERGVTSALSRAELVDQVANLSASFRAMGVVPGDRIAAVLPNIAPTVVAVLAAASVGAVWSCCAPDFGLKGLIDRFAQIEPTVLIGVDGYLFNGRVIERSETLLALHSELPTVKQLVMVRNVGTSDMPAGATDFSTLLVGDAAPAYEPVPFGHPLWILYSSGTTGLPKGIIHSHGGVLLESLKANALHYDLTSSDIVFIAASTAWVVWNMLVDAMAAGSTIVTYDGSPTAGQPDRLFRICAEHGVTRFGSGAAYLTACEKSGSSPRDELDLSALRSIMSTGSPLPDSTWRWVYSDVKPDVLLGSDSGGTDVATAFVGANPFEDVVLGELQGPCLGVAVEAWSEQGQPVVDEVGEMVITAPMPSMPIGFWGDEDGSRYTDAYFTTFPGVWRHGDWITITRFGTCVVHGRSDSTINRGGVRMGSADIYQVVDAFPEVASSLVVGVELPDGDYFMPLFVVPKDGSVLDDGLIERIRAAIRRDVSPRHVPDTIVVAPDVPTTRTGKRLEVPIKRLLQGAPESEALNRGSVADLDTLNWYVAYASRFRAGRTAIAGQPGISTPA